MKIDFILWRSLGGLLAVVGLYVLIHLAVTEKDVTRWIVPTGLLALAMVVAGLKWLIRGRKLWK